MAWVLAPLPWLVAHFLPPHNHDAAALLQFSERWLRGERLYVDLIDVNPPLIMILGLLPAWIGQNTPLSATAALVLCSFGFAVVGVLLGWRVLKLDESLASSPFCLAYPGLFLYLALVHPGIEFAQRENLMVMAALPYLLLAAQRADQRPAGRALTVLVAIFAAVGFAIKPHFLVVPLLVEAYVLARCGLRRWLHDPLIGSMAVVLAAYGAWVLWAVPEYLSDVVPLARELYVDLGIGAHGRLGVLFYSALTPSLGLLVVLGGLMWVRRPDPLAWVLFLAALGGITLAVWQGKGWDYQLLPAQACVLVLAAYLGSVWFADARTAVVAGAATPVARKPGTPDGWRSGAVFLIAFLIALYFLTTHVRPLFPRKMAWETGQGGQLLLRVRRESGGRAVMALTPGIFPHFPVFNYAHTRQALRFMNLWPLQAVYAKCLPDGARYRDPAAMPAAETWVIESVVEDFSRHDPRLVIVDRNPGIAWCGREFDFLEYFLRDARFSALWTRYELLESFDRYRLYVRKEAQ